MKNLDKRTCINRSWLFFQELSQLLGGFRWKGVLDEAAAFVQLQEVPGQVFCPDELPESTRGRIQKEGLGKHGGQNNHSILNYFDLRLS